MSRTVIRSYRPDDYDVVRRWIDDPIVTGGFPSAAPPHSDGDVWAIVRGQEAPNLSRLAIEVDGRVVGEVQYRHSPPLFPTGAFGLGVTVFDPADRGNGFGKESQRLLTDLLFRERAARRVQAETDPMNARERGALEAIGFKAEGVLRRYFEGEGSLGDLVMYAMTRDDWEERRDTWTSTS